MRLRSWLTITTVFTPLLAVVAPAAGAGLDYSGAPAGFVGEVRCGNPTCHGGGLPSTEEEKEGWHPWMSARTQWINRNIDRHSRAYATLESKEGRQIAAYMGIDSTTSPKCTICHAPAARVASGGSHRAKDGVSCEHCHGPAEFWIDPHIQKDWPSKRAGFFEKGFYDNGNLTLRAQRCAACHVDIDHEIVAGGHPPLQFEMVAYAQIMKHWEDPPRGGVNVDPTIWAIGQVVGLRDAVEMAATRAGEQNYQAIGKFSHFESKNCYQCHHKLVEDALRQARGHEFMVESLLRERDPGRAGQLAGAWQALNAAAQQSPEATKQKAQGLLGVLAGLDTSLLANPLSRDATRNVLKRITASGEQLKGIERFSYNRPETSNVVSIAKIEYPWWYTTGGPEQAILAIGALCEPGWSADTCRALVPERKQLLRAADRFAYDPAAFAAALAAVNRKL
jgi:Cytochrome c554 and c-prime